ncbi:hypothetical protein MSAN_01179800 [Mycena sanguinolenta]|uniref:Uncharacterized protein n=1 Tax=Mycena sanguinolenta TaxID=230812 RepID=A0A8H7D798_9AGAR|nr:hypothetical protein MSAN_01179800 [Mycena sanguinolenta]
MPKLKPHKVRGPTTAAIAFNPQCIPSPPSINSPPPLEESYSYQSSDYTTATVAFDPEYPSPPSINSPPPLEESYSSQFSDHSSYSGFSTPPYCPPPLAPATLPTPGDTSPTLVPQRTTFIPRHPELLVRPRLLIPTFDGRQSQRMFIYQSPSDHSASSASPPAYITDYHPPASAPSFVPLAHPMPRAVSQPRSPLLDYPGDEEGCDEVESSRACAYPTIQPPQMPKYIQQHYAHAQQAAEEYSPPPGMCAASYVSPEQPPALLSPLELSEHTPLRTFGIAFDTRVSLKLHYNYYPDYDAPPGSYPFSTHQVPRTYHTEAYYTT